MAAHHSQRDVFPPGYLLEDSHGIPVEYEFPPEPWTPGEGLVRASNLALKKSFSVLGDMYNSMRRRRIMDTHDLCTYGVPNYDHQAVVTLIKGDQGVLSLRRQILAMGGEPMPIPDEIGKKWEELLNTEAYDDVWKKPLGLLKPASHIIHCQEFANFSFINEKIQIPLHLRAHSMNFYLRDHYEEMARLYNRVLSNRHKQHLLPPSYSRVTNELAEILMKMREVALECIQEILDSGGIPFKIPAAFGEDKLVVISLFEDTYGTA